MFKLPGIVVTIACFFPACGRSPVPLVDGSAGPDATGGSGSDASRSGTSDAGPGMCRSGADCNTSSGFWCIGPYVPFRCGPIDDSTVGQPCTEDSNCARTEICRLAPTGADGGFACALDLSCTQDDQCGPNRVCRQDPTVPEGWVGALGLACAYPCATDADCAPTSLCETGGHCRPRTCAECPSYFSCINGACTIPSCSTDADCPGGYCVVGSCAGLLGQCRLLCL